MTALLLKGLIYVLSTIFTLALTIAMNSLSKYVNAKASGIMSDTNRAEFKLASDTVVEAVKTAVITVGNTYTDALKTAAEDGKLTMQEQQIAKAKAIDLAHLVIPEKAKEVLRFNGVDISAMLSAGIETVLKINKR